MKNCGKMATQIRMFGVSGLTGMRRTPIKGFRQFILFYRASDADFEVVRVWHGARD